jgi:CBS domain containing-hemolysin-like protein
MKNLHLYSAENVDKLAWPEEDYEISKNTPALSILTDFKQHRPRVIDANIQIDGVSIIMKQAHVKMKLVVDKAGKFMGIIGLNDLSEETIIKKVSEGETRSSLVVRDFMHPRDSLKSFDFLELMQATVSDVLASQKENQQQHCLVIDREKHEIRGLISARDVSRLLNRSVDIEHHLSFEALFDDLFKARVPLLSVSL